jgi:hypothetical protein
MSARTVSTLIVIFCIAGLIAAPFAAAQAIMPHAIFGTVRDEGGTPMTGATVTLRNQRTTDTLTNITNSLGQYQADLYSMPGGYQVGDAITVSAVSRNLMGSTSMNVSPNAMDQCNITIKATVAEPEPFKILGINWIIVTVIAVSIISIVLIAIFASTHYASQKVDENKENKKGRRRK